MTNLDPHIRVYGSHPSVPTPSPGGAQHEEAVDHGTPTACPLRTSCSGPAQQPVLASVFCLHRELWVC